MATRRNLGTLSIAAGFGLLTLSNAMELQGDLATVPADRLSYHLIALVILVVAAACFVRSGVLIYRTISGQSAQPEAERLAKVFGDEEPALDPDAALARYMERRAAADLAKPATPVARPAPRGAGFGRKQL